MSGKKPSSKTGAVTKCTPSVKKQVKIQPAPKAGKISVEKIQRAVDSVSKPKKKK